MRSVHRVRVKRVSRKLGWLVSLVALSVLAAAAAPVLVRAYWEHRASNPVRRGLRLAGELRCFSCHGALGGAGLPDPGATIGEVPSWGGGTWMMYITSDEQIRQFILDGVSEARRDSATARAEREKMAIHMPAYRGYVSDRDVEDLVATFKVLSRMVQPGQGTPERRGLELARHWQCFGCHGPAGSGGLSNPGSFTGFIPGWYGPDFDDLVRDRDEFDGWIREGRIPRLVDHPIASHYFRRQRVSMPAYANLGASDVDDLWAYVQWLHETDGGYRVVETSP